MSRGWRRCWPGCRRRCLGRRSTGCAAAVASAAHAIVAGAGALFIGGGVESMTRAPLVMAKPEAAWPRGNATMYDTTLGWRFVNPALAEAHYPYSMGETAENVAERYGISRADQDAF